MTQPVRVVVAEPDNIMAAVLLECLEGDEFSVVRVDERSGDVVDVVRSHDAQVLLVGPAVPRSTLAAEIPHLLAKGCRTLVVSGALDEQTFTLLLAGASGWLLADDASVESVAQAVSSVAAGSTALHPLVAQAVLERWRTQRAIPQAVGGGFQQVSMTPTVESTTLSKRELEVLAGLREGLSNRLLAGRLGVAEKTIEAHKSRLYAKLGARNQAHAVRIATDRGLG